MVISNLLAAALGAARGVRNLLFGDDLEAAREIGFLTAKAGSASQGI
jgi:hypothetical protein